MNNYNLDGIKTEITKQIAINKAYLNEWKKVTFPTKKDGTPFATMSKNISGAKYKPVNYAMQSGEYELEIYTECVPGYGYQYESIKIYELVRYLKDKNMIAKTDNYMPKSPYLEQVYKFDIEDIKTAVARHIEYLKEYIADLEKQLEETDRIYNNFKAAIKSAFETLEKDTNKFTHKTLYYAVKDTVINRYPYC